MTRPAERDLALLLDIEGACRSILVFLGERDRAAFFADSMAVSAVLYQLTILGEATKRLSEPFRAAHTEIPWKEIARMRDLVIHLYHRVDLEAVWTAAVRDVPSLRAKIQPLLPPKED